MMLTVADIALHQSLGIDADLLTQAQVHRVDDHDGRALLGLNGKAGDFAGVVYPYVHPRLKYQNTARLRIDHPPTKADGTPDGKYRQPYGDRRHLFFPPGADILLEDISVQVVFVESEKAVLALTAAANRAGRRLLVVALGGCWNFRGRIGTETDANGARVDVKGPLPDFALITLVNRDAIVLYDARPNASVQAARHVLARLLRGWGASVRHAHLPDDDQRVNGPDDFVGARGDEALWHLLDSAAAEDFARKDGAIMSNSLDNIRLALSKLGIRLTFDQFAREVCMAGRAVDDSDIDRLWVQIDDRLKFRPSKETLRTVVTTEADEHPVHPVRAYLDGLTWDHVPRLDSWLVTYGGAADSAYVRAVGALPLIAAVRRVRTPATKFDELLILESDQGTFKSSALRALCPNEAWFSDDLPLGVDSKLVIERTAGKWIIEAAELHGNRGREAEALKAFLSRQVDGPVRLAYGRLPTTVPRQFILIGTTNSRLAYLKDMTGARRFWPVSIAFFELAALQRDRDQLWAEAAAREAAGESIRLDAHLWREAAEQQEDRRAGDPWESILEPLLDGDGVTMVEHVSVSAIWERLKIEANQLDNRHADRVAAIVQRYGFTRKARVRIDGKRGWYWVRAEVSS